MDQKPSVGRIVHYVSYGTPGGEYASQCRAAIITEVGEGLLPEVASVPEAEEIAAGAVVVGLAVLNPTGMFFNRATYHDGAAVPGDPDCPDREHHADGPFRYCQCGWTEPSYRGGSWHWPERV